MTSRSCRLAALAVLLALCALPVVGSTPRASGQAALEGRAQQLRQAIAAENARIGATSSGLAEAQRRLAMLTTRARVRQAQVTDAQTRLLGARIELSRLQHREAASKRALAANLVAQYEAGRPQLITIVLSATRLSDLYERLEFYKRLSRQNAKVLGRTRTARAAVAGETVRLQGLWARYSRLAEAAVEDRARADTLESALLVRQRSQLARRDAAGAQLAGVRARIAAIQRRQAAAAARAAAVSTSTAQAPAVSPAPSVGDASGVVARVVAAANQIASTPYVWGGGHGGASGGYDCSGSISYALAAGGLLSGSLDSTGFMSWGDAGPGAHITVYANAGHAFMIVDGRRFDTSALSGGGTRWTSASRSTAGFVARHPPGL